MVDGVGPFSILLGALYLRACALVLRLERTRKPSDLEYEITVIPEFDSRPFSAELANAWSYKIQVDPDGT